MGMGDHLEYGVGHVQDRFLVHDIIALAPIVKFLWKRMTVMDLVYALTSLSTTPVLETLVSLLLSVSLFAPPQPFDL